MAPPRILITGAPGCGKTTLIKKVAESISIPYCGFFTAEIRRQGKRVGFEIESFSAAKAVMSHVDTKSPYKVGRYGVDIESINRIAIPEMETAISRKQLLIIDEIGKMELCSEKFKNLITQVFRTNIPFIGTILFRGHPFCEDLKRFAGTEILTLARGNFETSYERTTSWLKKLDL